jgi:hypothetical protein
MSTMGALGFVERDAVARVAPLGVRFWDSVVCAFITEGLVVSHSWARGTRKRTAIVNHASVFVLAGLPDLHDLEFADHPTLTQAGARAGDADYWRLIPSLARSYRIDVVDMSGRFLPFWFDAPLPHRGLFELAYGSPLSSPPASRAGAVPLFSSPARTPPSGAGTVRAQLREPSGTPAAWALLEVAPVGAQPVRALADEQGRVVAIVPYPAPSSTAGSPPSGRARPLAEERWELDVRCFYDRSSPPGEPPNIGRVLEQAPASLDLELSPPETIELAFGRDLVLRTPGRSEVLVTPASSPP